MSCPPDNKVQLTKSMACLYFKEALPCIAIVYIWVLLYGFYDMFVGHGCSHWYSVPTCVHSFHPSEHIRRAS